MKLIIFFVLYLHCNFIQAQKFNIVNSVSVKGNFYTTDNLGNIYGVSDFTLTKYNSSGYKIAEFNSNTFGEITSIDASNPFKLLIYSKEFNNIVFLDNTLSKVGKIISFDDIDIDTPTLVSSSQQGGYWIFDEYDNQLYNLDDKNAIVRQCIAPNPQNINGTDIEEKFTCLIEQNNHLYLCAFGYGILVFDNFGTYYETIKIEQINQIQITNKNFIYIIGNNLIVYNYKEQIKQKIKLPGYKKIQNCRIEQNYLYVFSEYGFEIFRIN